MSKLNTTFEKSKISDLKNPDVPECLYWTCEQVCEFFEHRLKLPEYKETLRCNKIDGRRLVYLDASHLSKLGIQDFKHIMLITKHVRNLLKIKVPCWNTSISQIPKETIELYLEAKSVNGAKSDKLSYEEFQKNTEDMKWQPPLTNQGFSMPSY